MKWIEKKKELEYRINTLELLFATLDKNSNSFLLGYRNLEDPEIIENDETNFREVAIYDLECRAVIVIKNCLLGDNEARPIKYSELELSKYKDKFTELSKNKKEFKSYINLILEDLEKNSEKEVSLIQ